MTTRESKGRASPLCWLARPFFPARLRSALLVTVALLVGSAWPVFGQVGSAGQLAVRSDGFIFWIQAGQRHVVYPSGLSDEQINALPDGAPLSASLSPPAAIGSSQPSAQLPPGSGRASRLALGQVCTCTIVHGPGQRNDLQIRVVSIQREAWAILQKTNTANQRPKDGFEYVMVTLNVKYTSGPRDLPVSIDRFDFTLLDSSDALYTAAFVIEPQPLSSVSAYPGTEVTGTVTYQIPRGDPDPVLVWHYNDDNPVWFSIS